MAAVVHKYKGAFEWEGMKVEAYSGHFGEGAKGVSAGWLVGPEDKPRHFTIRYYELEPGGYGSVDHHEEDHGVIILRGRGRLLLGSKEVEASFGDVFYIPPYEVHQFRNPTDEPFGWLGVWPWKS